MAKRGASTEDRFTTLGPGFNGKLNDRLDIGVDYIASDSTGRLGTDNGSGDASFPSLKTGLKNVRVRLSYRVNRQWAWSFSAEHESYDSRDWQIDGLGNDGISAILTLGEISPDYSITLLRVYASYSF
jgi:hypothetical protein